MKNVNKIIYKWVKCFLKMNKKKFSELNSSKAIEFYRLYNMNYSKFHN